MILLSLLSLWRWFHLIPDNTSAEGTFHTCLWALAITVVLAHVCLSMHEPMFLLASAVLFALRLPLNDHVPLFKTV